MTVDPAWAVEVVAGEPGTTGRALQTAKDRVMGERADWGLAYFNPIEVNRFGNLQVSSGTIDIRIAPRGATGEALLYL